MLHNLVTNIPHILVERCDLATITQAATVHDVCRLAAAGLVLAPSAASLVLDQTAQRHVHTLHATDHHSPGRRLDRHRHHVLLNSSVPDLNSHPLREVVAGRDFGLGSPNQTTGEEGTG